ncbi:MAG: multiubiquitin domain-containing protein [Burkholderiaceae bacterium]
MSPAPQGAEAKQPPHVFNIQIDRVHYKIDRPTLSGAELRRVPAQAIGPERDLFQVVPGGPDTKIRDDDEVSLHDGARFFTAPAQINPGLTD